MGELEDAQGRSDVLRAEVATRRQRRGHGGGFVAQLGLSVCQRRLVDRPREVGVQKSFLHRLNLGQPFLLRNPLFTLNVADVPERHLQRSAEPLGQCVVGNANRLQIRMDCVLQIVGPPAHAGVVGVRIVVRAAVVVVNANTSPFQLPLDPFAGDHRSTMLTREQSAGERHVDLLRCAPDLAIENLLAHRERPLVNQRSMLAGVVPVAPADVPDVDAVPQDAGERRAMKLRIARLVGVAFPGELVGQRFERVPTAGVQLEGTHDRLRIVRMRFNRFVLIVGAVHVAVRGKAMLPALPAAFLDPLENLRSQVVAVVLGDGGHHVERQRSGWSRSKLVVDEREGHAVLIFEFLHPDRIPHVAADAVELMAQDCPKILTFCVRFDPADHVVEGLPGCSALG